MTTTKRQRKSPRYAWFEWLDIPHAAHPDRVILRRLRIVQTPLFGIFVHWIIEPDPGPGLHEAAGSEDADG